jgi:hypothetical protein
MACKLHIQVSFCDSFHNISLSTSLVDRYAAAFTGVDHMGRSVVSEHFMTSIKYCALNNSLLS